METRKYMDIMENPVQNGCKTGFRYRRTHRLLKKIQFSLVMAMQLKSYIQLEKAVVNVRF